MKAIVIAFQFMTRIPLPAVDARPADLAAAMRWFPLTGVAVGAVVWGATWMAGEVDTNLAALAGVVAWVAITGALHLDGLGDVADGAGAAHRDKARLSAAMADPHIGSFGVVAIVLQLAAKIVLLGLLAERSGLHALPAIGCVARIGPLAWAMLLPPLHEGIGTKFATAMEPRHLAIWALVGAGLAWFLPAILLAVPALGVWALWVRSRLGGISGDSHGAGIELVETALLIACVVSA